MPVRRDRSRKWQQALHLLEQRELSSIDLRRALDLTAQSARFYLRDMRKRGLIRIARWQLGVPRTGYIAFYCLADGQPNARRPDAKAAARARSRRWRAARTNQRLDFALRAWKPPAARSSAA